MSTSNIVVPITASQDEPSSNSDAAALLILRTHIENGCKKMNKGESYTLGQILNLTVEGRLYWLLETSPTSVGSVFAVMVGKQLFPLTFAGKTSSNARLYKLA